MRLSIIAVLLTSVIWSACGGDGDSSTRTPVAEKQTAGSEKNMSPEKASKDVAPESFKPGHREMSRPGVISEYDKIIRKYARRYLFDWRLIAAQIHTESTFRRTAKSYRGALGLMQIMPGTAQWLEGKSEKSTPELKGVSRMLVEPEMNIHLGCYYDAMLFSRIKNFSSGDDRHKMMFAAYNAGPGNLNKARRKSDSPGDWVGIREHLPEETRKYIPKIYNRYEIYKKWTVLNPY